MKNPYEVLGINKNATDEEVKKAYRDLARKYHPDNYTDNPLADLASEKMKEVNEAYDAIISHKKNFDEGNTGDNSYASSNYPDIRRMINAKRYDDAQQLLDGVPIANRDAEWYFLNGVVARCRGWFDQAYTSFSTACQMDPGNAEYRNAFNGIQHARRGNFAGNYGNGYPNTNTGCSSCDVCSSLICADCCCEAMGGDCISCC